VSEKPRVWTVKRVGSLREEGASSYPDAVGIAERRGVDVLVLCDGALVASWSTKHGLRVLNAKLAGLK
jgi:hypothetical protein